jgi:hypothetical protein
MNPIFSLPPCTKGQLTPPQVLAEWLQCLIGKKFQLTGKTRTDGSTLRKLIAETLEKQPLPPPCQESMFKIVPPKRKGVPRILLEYLDIYIVTSGKSYNLQVWNRNPATRSVQVEYRTGERLLTNEVRFVFVRVDPTAHEIRAVLVLTPNYIVQKFGRFGKPIIKYQLIITDSARQAVLSESPPVLFYPDLKVIAPILTEACDLSLHSIHDEPSPRLLIKLESIRSIVVHHLIDTKIDSAATKTRGQVLEEKMCQLLGYPSADQQFLAGEYPDIRHQALEVKIQDSRTVDLGRYSPQFVETVPRCANFTTESIRYLIALTDNITGIIKGAIICPGRYLGKHFTFVGGKSFKCQRSIPMSFFEKYDGQSIFNP